MYSNLCKRQMPGDGWPTSEPPADFANSGRDADLQLAVRIDETVRRVRPDDWRGHQAKENEIKRALLPLLHNDVSEVERIFPIIKAQREY